MDDAIFRAKLFSNDLLPGDLRNQLNLWTKSVDKASHFLDSAIKPSVTIDGGSSFLKLLIVMEDSKYENVRKLAASIRTNLATNLRERSQGIASINKGLSL